MIIGCMLIKKIMEKIEEADDKGALDRIIVRINLKLSKLEK